MSSISASGTDRDGSVVETDIPARLDRLPWSRWHWRIVFGLGAVWILDGLEVNFLGMISARLSEKGSGLALSSSQGITAGAVYVAGACTGAVLFGHLTDRYGRRRLFLITLALYLAATVLTGASFSVWWFYLMRFLTGAGIGGEYAAINSAVDELIPARVRGTIDLVINGSFWLGTVLAGAMALLLLDNSLFALNVGWRLGFAVGALLGLGILFIRRQVPESPRWLVIHGHDEEADRVVRAIEGDVLASTDVKDLPEPEGTIRIEQRRAISFFEIARTIFASYPRRTVVGLALFAGQAFLYNAVVFAQADLLKTFFNVGPDSAPLYIIPFAAGNFLGPIILGRFFDTVGRKPMIAGTYIVSGVLLAVTAFLFKSHTFSAWGLTAAWCVIFFFASAGASSAYLTVSEIFPMETRALAIALFYSVGTALGGITGPLLFAQLVQSGHVTDVFWGYLLGATLMVLGGVIEATLGLEVAQQRLEEIAKPLTATEGEEPAPSEGGRPAPSEAGASAPQRTASAPRGRRRPRPSGTSGWSSFPVSSPRAPAVTYLEPEVAAIERALTTSGPQSRDQLAQMVGARYWGPRRFASALAAAMAEGRVRRAGRNRFERVSVS
ncbi:MAG: MFS transporter [Solirubrobacterales bacterium]|nr:MFS transporter [Solirubrobacterales bacterium]